MQKNIALDITVFALTMCIIALAICTLGVDPIGLTLGNFTKVFGAVVLGVAALALPLVVINLDLLS